jgi:hypothetical protein
VLRNRSFDDELGGWQRCQGKQEARRKKLAQSSLPWVGWGGLKNRHPHGYDESGEGRRERKEGVLAEHLAHFHSSKVHAGPLYDWQRERGR